MASLGWFEENEGFLWKKKWKRNKTGWPCLSHFLLPRQWVACLPLPAGVRGFVWCGLGLGLLAGVVFALATTEPRWEVTFSDQRTEDRDQEVETYPSHWNLLPLTGACQPIVHMGAWT